MKKDQHVRVPGFVPLASMALLATALLWPGTAAAQWRYLFPPGFTLTDEDMQTQLEAILRLVRAEPPPIGQEEQWSNPGTGARGTVTMLTASEVRQMPCRRLRFQIDTRQASAPVDMTFTLCRAADGLWKIG